MDFKAQWEGVLLKDVKSLWFAEFLLLTFKKNHVFFVRLLEVGSIRGNFDFFSFVLVERFVNCIYWIV